jgi:putative glutamine amidotransferase
MDHREDTSLPKDKQYSHAHEIHLTGGGILQRLYGNDAANVNSLHGQGINKLGEGLIVEAVAPDSLVEAVRVENADSLALGVQWHPEWEFWQDDLSRVIFKAFGDAVKQRHKTSS